MQYRTRIIEPTIERLVRDVPAILLLGPRAVGKTTTAARYCATVIRLDEPAESAAFAADPDAALRGLAEPVLLDEWQYVPSIMGAIKRAVDRDPRPGRFIVAGSANAALDGTWSGTGRLTHLTMHGMSVREANGAAAADSFLDVLIDHPDRLMVTADVPDLRGYVEVALRSGFPELLEITSPESRSDWIASYLNQVLARDVSLIGVRRAPETMQRFVEAYAATSAGVVTDTTLRDAAGIDKRTASAYEQVLEELYVIERVPSWWTNRLKRLVATPKRFVLDTGLMAAALRADVDAVVRDGTVLGRLIETFVAAQLRPELAASRRMPRLHHLRQQQGRHEIDLLVEVGGGIVAFEIKAGSAPTAADAAHLAWLRDQLGESFLRGVVLHTGPRAFALGDRLLALPIGAIWSAPAA